MKEANTTIQPQPPSGGVGLSEELLESACPSFPFFTTACVIVIVINRPLSNQSSEILFEFLAVSIAKYFFIY